MKLGLWSRILEGVRGLGEVFKKAYRRGGIWWMIFTISMIIIALDFIILALLLLRFL